MVGRIKLFRCVRRLYKTMGILPPSKHPEKFSFNWRNLGICSSNLITLALEVVFLFFKAKSIQEYGLSFYACASLIWFEIDVSIMVLQMPNILKLMENLETFIELSEFQFQVQ